MKDTKVFVSIFISFLILLTVLDSSAATRTALVIGNSKYKTSPLKNPANDANDMAVILKQSGFNVTLITNASQRKMKIAVKSFGKKLRQNGGVGLFYYAGHALQVNGRNYLIPIDADIDTESEVEFEAIDAGRILGQMEDAGNDINIVILDACRNNPYAGSFRSPSRGLVKIVAPTGSLIAYATAPGSVAADGDGRNGIYTKHLIQHIKMPGLTIERVLKNVRVAVLKETGKKQTPWESSSLAGEFYFNKQADREKSKHKVKVDQSDDKSYELLFWKSIMDSTDAESFKAYLSEFPNGKFSRLAKIKIRTMSIDSKNNSITDKNHFIEKSTAKIKSEAKATQNLLLNDVKVILQINEGNPLKNKLLLILRDMGASVEVVTKKWLHKPFNFKHNRLLYNSKTDRRIAKIIKDELTDVLDLRLIGRAAFKNEVVFEITDLKKKQHSKEITTNDMWLK